MAADGKINEECAVFGVSLKTDEAVGITYNGLLALQHRGQEGAGIAVVDKHNIVCVKDVGLVSEVFSGDEIAKIPKGQTAVGHCRYSTTGKNTKENVGPFLTEYLTGRIATAHNGNITNAPQIREELIARGIQFNATSDSEVLSSLIAYHITQETRTIVGIIKALDCLRGSFSLVIATSKNKLVAIRDPNGFRPLCIGKNESGYAAASESCALEVCGFEFVRDVLPGEAVVIQGGEITHEGLCLYNKEEGRGLCIFEYVYFARPDSVVDGLSIYEARYTMGVILAQEYPVDADVVCGVPDSGLVAATGYSAQSGIPLMSGFVKNRYIGRSFIYPTQTQRDSAVRQKLNPLAANVRGKRVVLVDDSIVRGTTSERIVRSLRNAGAKEVHMRISSPPFRHTCHYGTDIGSEENLIANKMNLDDITRKLGVDSLGYISIDGLKTACSKCVLPFCDVCFTGDRVLAHTKKNIFE
ncbi:MAG: amidophosphoribosyltransferase [Chitinispirillia bacterium]|nr:amidophosphoribosyltransferase [Chitinispirillia bacterium]MCL2269525.1 amidophosphoribosyltransferase [Chitinispirillia bacterium]